MYYKYVHKCHCQCTVYTLYYNYSTQPRIRALYSVQYTLFLSQCSVHAVNYIIQIVQCIVYMCVKCTHMYSKGFILLYICFLLFAHVVVEPSQWSHHGAHHLQHKFMELLK